jgi:hypothetical protein
MIIGRDLQIVLGMDILFSTKHLKWDGMVIPMRTPDANLSYLDTQINNIGNLQDVLATASTLCLFLMPNIKNATINSLKHLSNNQQQQLKALLYKFEHLFDGTLGIWNTDPVSFKLKEGAKPFQLAPFSVPKIQRLCVLGENPK